MDLTSVERDFKEKVCSQVSLVREGLNRYRVLNPFLFDDGDHLSIVMKREKDEWVLSDEGHTYMHLSYDLDDADLQKGTRQKIISNVLSFFEVLDRQGELVMPVRDNLFGDTLLSFAQALLKVFDVGYLSRERVLSTFLEDFKVFMQEALPADRLTFDWSDTVKDPKGMYKVDCRVTNGQAPLFVYALPNDDRVRDATIAALQFEKWGLPFHSLGIFEDQEAVNRKVLARFTDVFEKSYSNLGRNKERISRFLKEYAH